MGKASFSFAPVSTTDMPPKVRHFLRCIFLLNIPRERYHRSTVGYHPSTDAYRPIRGRIPLADASSIHRLCSITAPSPHARRRQGGRANPPCDTAYRTSWMPCHTAARFCAVYSPFADIFPRLLKNILFRPGMFFIRICFNQCQNLS